MSKELKKILKCIKDIDFILNQNDFKITQEIEDKIIKPAINMNILRITEQFKKLKDNFEIEILKNFKNEDLKSMSDIFGNYDLDDISVKNIIKNHLPTIKEKHLKEQDALKLFDSFEIEKSPFYIRIFNEMPRAVLDDFISRNNISKEKVLNIYNNLLLNTSFRINTYE